MRYLVWALRLLVFLAVLMFALKNTEPVTVRFYAEHLVTQVPLIVVMLACFVLGAVLGLLLTVPAGLRRRREIARLRREIEKVRTESDSAQSKTAGQAHNPNPDDVAPLAPL